MEPASHIFAFGAVIVGILWFGLGMYEKRLSKLHQDAENLNRTFYNGHRH